MMQSIQSATFVGMLMLWKMSNIMLLEFIHYTQHNCSRFADHPYTCRPTPPGIINMSHVQVALIA